MEAKSTGIEGLWVLKPKVFGDDRGRFCETFNLREFSALTGLHPDFVQDNEAFSRYGVLRGLHFQRGEHAQAKLVRVASGRVLDVALDIRRNSPTFGQYRAVELSGENFLQLYIPRGFAHGYAVLSDEAIFQYKTDNYYCPESEGAIAWNDPDLAIDWRLPEPDIILSPKDMAHPRLRDVSL